MNGIINCNIHSLIIKTLKTKLFFTPIQKRAGFIRELLIFNL